MTDPNDADFMDNLKKLLGMDVKNIETLIPKLSSSVLIDLADAVTHNDKKTVLKLIKAGREEAAELEESMSEDWLNKKDESKKKILIDSEIHYNVGDAVSYDGKKATVKISNGPGSTVGIMIGGRLEMVERKDIKKINEHVLGMSVIPDIKRMQELAGITSDSSLNADKKSVVEIEPIETETEDMDCGNSAIAMLDKVAEMLPDLKLSEIKEIRKRLLNIQMQMNESFEEKPKLGRKLKV